MRPGARAEAEVARETTAASGVAAAPAISTRRRATHAPLVTQVRRIRRGAVVIPQHRWSLLSSPALHPFGIVITTARGAAVAAMLP